MATAIRKTVTFVIISGVMLILAGESLGASPAPAPGPSSDVDCFEYLVNMSDCLTYVEKGSNLTAPEKGCCPELSRLMGTQPICLCKLLGDPSASLGIDIDIQKALKLPELCSVSTPPISYCAAAGYPIASPSPSPSPSPTEAHGNSSSSAAETPETGSKNGGSRSNKNLLLALFYAAFVSGLF